MRVEGIARFSVAPAKFQADRPCRRFFVRQHAKRVVFVHAVEGVQDAGQRHAVAGRRVRIELKAVPFDVGVDAGLRERGVGAGIYYPKPLHVYPHIAKLGYKVGDFPVAEDLAARVVSLPVHPKVSDEDVITIAKAVKEVLTNG